MTAELLITQVVIPFRQLLDQLSSLGIPNGRPSRPELGHGAKFYWGVWVVLHPINVIIVK